MWGQRYRRYLGGDRGQCGQSREAAITVADIGEFGLIAMISGMLPPGRAQIIGPGDDAAVIAAPDARVVATTDLLVEGRHFRRDWSGARDIGRKAAAQNLADVAAMGAAATALLVGLAAPGDLPVAWARELITGIIEESQVAGASVAGGDLSGADTVMIAITALGDLAGRDPVTRAGARPGDQVAVAGTLGGSAGGLAVLSAGLAGLDRPDPADARLAGLVAVHRRPRPPYPAGPQAAASGATSMIDVSDGLVADLRHVAQASGVLIDIRSDLLAASAAVPAAALQAAAAALARPHWLDWALSGGEDHALAATFPGGRPVPEGWSVIGSVTPAAPAAPADGAGEAGAADGPAGGPGVRVDGVRAAGCGWEHFRQTAPDPAVDREDHG